MPLFESPPGSRRHARLPGKEPGKISRIRKTQPEGDFLDAAWGEQQFTLGFLGQATCNQVLCSKARFGPQHPIEMRGRDPERACIERGRPMIAHFPMKQRRERLDPSIVFIDAFGLGLSLGSDPGSQGECRRKPRFHKHRPSGKPLLPFVRNPDEVGQDQFAIAFLDRKPRDAGRR